MLASAIPLRFAVPFASAAADPTYKRTIPVPTQIGIQDGAASFTDGFPPDTFTAQIAGGVPPFGADFNGLANIVTTWEQWFQAGGPVPWDSAFSTAIGGYPKGAIVQAALFGNGWVSTADNNVSNPDAGGAGWTAFSLFGGATTGDAKLTLKTTADNGWFIANDGSLGDATSGATTLADALCGPIFALVWNNVSNSYAPVQDSSGTPVARGINAAADFAAHRRIVFPKQLGRALSVAGAGSGLTARALGEFFGSNTATILQANLPNLTLATAIASGQGSHFHTIPSRADASGGAGDHVLSATPLNTDVTNAATLPAMTGTTPTGGSGTPLNIDGPGAGWNIMVKL